MAKINYKSEDYQIEQVDKAINELVYPKFKLQKYYNYYNGVRDAEQFRFLEENFGIGNPTSIQFTPLIKKHIDALIGEYLNTPIIPKISCKDEHTLSNIDRDKNLRIMEDTMDYLKTHLNNSLITTLGGDKPIDTSIEYQLNKIKEDIDDNFISSNEIAGQDIIEYILQNRVIDIHEKLRQLFLDLLITGHAYYKVVPSDMHNNISIEIYSPLNVFVDRNPESNYVKDSYRSVVRKWMTKHQILNKYGELLDDEARNELEEMFESQFDNTTMYVRGTAGNPTGSLSEGLIAGQELTPGFPGDDFRGNTYKLIPVFEVEYLVTEKEKKQYVLNRYENIRIGQSIHIIKGKSENITRSFSAPLACSLSLNGIFFNNRNTEPYSLVGACMALQDRYDMMNFYKDSLVANSGTVGDWIDVSMLPAVLGNDVPDRLQKWIAYKKGGVALLDSSQEGRQFNNNTTFAGFDDTVKANAVQAVELVIQSIESTCSSITGVFRERLNGIQQHDAVTNVKVGAQNSFVVTKQYFCQMDLVLKELLTDSLNMAKRVFKNGLVGSYILGDKYQKVFTALPKDFSVTDYEINVVSSADVIKDLETIKQFTMELVKSGAVDVDILMETMTSKSLTHLKMSLNKAMKKKKAENDQISKLTQELQKAQEQIKQAQEQLKEATKASEELKKRDIDFERELAKGKNDIEWFKAKSAKEFNEKTLAVEEKRIEIEYAQLHDSNPNNDEIKDRL